MSPSSAWKRDSFSSPAEYTIRLDDADRAEMRAAIDAIRRSGRLAAPERLGKADFPFRALGGRLRDAYEQVRGGRGFAVLSGLPVDGSLQDFMAAVWGVGTWLGEPLSQNAHGELIGHVIDATAEEATPRMYRSNLELRLHSDITAMIGLACWHKAEVGGASFLASGTTIHDAIRAEAPELVEALYRGFHYHRVGEEADGEETATPYRTPVFAVKDGVVSTRYQRAGIAAGHRERGVPLTETELEALDLFDRTASAEENRLAFYLERGDMLLINNYAVLHARTRFSEFPDPAMRRHLVRVWLDAPGFRDVPAEFRLFPSANGVPPQPGKSCTFDFRKLYSDDPRASGGMPKADLTELAAGGSR